MAEGGRIPCTSIFNRSIQGALSYLVAIVASSAQLLFFENFLCYYCWLGSYVLRTFVLLFCLYNFIHGVCVSVVYMCSDP